VNSGQGVVSSSGFGGDFSLQLTAHGSGRNKNLRTRDARSPAIPVEE
jgi:hypothetical protein